MPMPRSTKCGYDRRDLRAFPDTLTYERSIVMYVRERPYEGIPARLYRSIAEIRRDMEIIEEKIRETEKKLSVHSLISGIMESGSRVIDKSVVLTLELVLADAENSLFRLERVRDAMNYLEEELSEVRELVKRYA